MIRDNDTFTGSLSALHDHIPAFRLCTEFNIDNVNQFQHRKQDLLQSLRLLFEELNNAVQIPIIATNRISTEGGGFTGSEEERIQILLSVLE
ncbi:MAG: type I 3-dehydroquinate dehydratase, partial [Methanosarcinales archaeon]|nr:type I 3-dehydroquinate dehydratase [Methanosarcinales archaeon]